MTVEVLTEIAIGYEANERAHQRDRNRGDANRQGKKPENRSEPRTDRECKRCGRSGHVAEQCQREWNWIQEHSKTPTAPKRLSREEYAKTVTCARCKQKGHYATDCKNAAVSNESKPLTTPKKDTPTTTAKRVGFIKPGREAGAKPDTTIASNEPVTDMTGQRTPCILEGQRVIAFVDGGASHSFVTKKWVEENGIEIVSRDGTIKQFIGGCEQPRLGAAEKLTLENGRKTLQVDLEVAELEGEEELVIGRDLFQPLGYEMMNVPFTWPESATSETKTSHKERITPEYPEGLDEFGVAPEWKDVIARNQAIPKHARCKLPGAELSIDTVGEPVWTRQYPIPEARKPVVDERVQGWWDDKLVVPAPPDCQWNTPLLAANKPSKEDGVPDGVRVCGDYQRVNTLIPRLPDSNLPTLREVHDSLGSFEWISVIDLADSYHQFPIREQDQQKTAFTWGRFGQLMFTGVPFGLKIMTGHMQRLMERLFGPLGLKPFQDDIAIASKTKEDHIRDVKRVLELLTDVAGLRINLKKCQFFRREARVLGSIISGTGIRIDPKKIKAITEWQPPENGKTMQRFLGVANFHWIFQPSTSRSQRH